MGVRAEGGHVGEVVVLGMVVGEAAEPVVRLARVRARVRFRVRARARVRVRGEGFGIRGYGLRATGYGQGVRC